MTVADQVVSEFLKILTKKTKLSYNDFDQHKKVKVGRVAWYASLHGYDILRYKGMPKQHLV
jgi:hypothetical protein